MARFNVGDRVLVYLEDATRRATVREVLDEGYDNGASCSCCLDYRPAEYRLEYDDGSSSTECDLDVEVDDGG